MSGPTEPRICINDVRATVSNVSRASQASEEAVEVDELIARVVEFMNSRRRLVFSVEGYHSTRGWLRVFVEAVVRINSGTGAMYHPDELDELDEEEEEEEWVELEAYTVG